MKIKDGISTKELKNGTNIFIHYTIPAIKTDNGKKKTVKENVTKKYGITTQTEAKKKLQKIQVYFEKNSYKSTDAKNVLFDDLYSKYHYEGTKREVSIINAKYSYEHYAQDKIGHFRIKQFDEPLAQKRLAEIFDDIRKTAKSKNKGVANKGGDATLVSVRNLLSPIFKEAFENKDIIRNPLSRIKVSYKRKGVQLNINKKIRAENIKQIYRTMLNVRETENWKNIRRKDGYILWLLVVMLGRRIGELYQLEYEDIDFSRSIVYVRDETEKSTLADKLPYPIPREVIKLLDKTKKGRVFEGSQENYYLQFKKNLDYQGITEKSLGHRISPHIMRNFLLSIVGAKFGVETVGRLALSHKESTVNDFYNSKAWDDMLEMYQWYWEILRSDLIEIETVDIPLNEEGY